MVVPPDPLNFAEDPTRWLIVGTSFLAALSMGAVAFGPAIVFHVCVAVMSWVSGHPTDQATLIGLIMIAMTPPAVVQAVLTWRDVSWSMCTLLLSPAIITVPLGTLLLLALNPKPVARAVGVVVIIFALIRCFMEVRTLDLRWRAKKRQVAHPSEAKPLLRDDSSSNNHNRHEDNTVMVMASPSHKDGTLDTPPVVLTAASPGAADPPPKQPCCVWPTRGMFMLQGFTGACVGFFLGFMAIPGLPLMMLVAVVPLPKHIMRATITMTVTALHPVQVGFLVYKTPHIVNKGLMITYAVSAVAALLGLAVGRWIHSRYVTNEGARRCVLGMLVVSATLLGASGSYDLIAVSLGIQVVFVFVAAVLVCKMGWFRLPMKRDTKATDEATDAEVQQQFDATYQPPDKADVALSPSFARDLSTPRASGHDVAV